jgi:hypothetical protein
MAADAGEHVLARVYRVDRPDDFLVAVAARTLRDLTVAGRDLNWLVKTTGGKRQRVMKAI